MKRDVDLWSDVGLPVATTLGTFCALNLLWSLLGEYQVALYDWVPRALSVYMVGGLVALLFLARAIRRGTLTADEIGLGAGGWQPWYRLFAFALTLPLVAYLYLGPSAAKTPLQFSDYCFWFYFLLQASLAELLIFLCIGYCLPEKWLRTRHWTRWQTILLAGLFSGVTFGWHHYTGEPQHHQWSWVTIPVMWINLLYFIPTRNFQLTLLLHNAVAAVGFTQYQHSGDPPEPWDTPAFYNRPFYITVFIIAFLLPYLLLHCLEWWATTRQRESAPTPMTTETVRPQPLEAT